MAINVFGKTSGTTENKFDTTLFVQKPYLRNNYIQSNIEEEIDRRNENGIKKL